MNGQVQLGLYGPQEARGQHQIRAVVEVLLRDRLRFIGVLHALQGSRIINPQDAVQLQDLEHALKGSPVREAISGLKALGQANARLLALLIAYAVYEVHEN